jgi:hypothetical protein
VIADSQGVGQIEGRRLDGLERRVDTRDLLIGATERAKNEEIAFRFGKDDPFAAAGADE